MINNWCIKTRNVCQMADRLVHQIRYSYKQLFYYWSFSI